VIPLAQGGRLLIFGLGMPSSGVPPEWAATEIRSGVAYADDLSDHSIEILRERIMTYRKPGDRVIASIHWGGNWDYGIANREIRFAHALIDEASVDLIHGHSSHHPKAVEVYHDKLILYGCGDFIDDYEGIQGYEAYRGDLGLMYFPRLAPESGALLSLEVIPTQVWRMQITRAQTGDALWLTEALNRESKRFGNRFVPQDDGKLLLKAA
jgi:poly-gamma-glutamate synthesis protein (capsule biosynthesis protein)